MIDENIYGDLQARCAGKVKIGVESTDYDGDFINHFKSFFGGEEVEVVEGGECNCKLILMRTFGESQQERIENCKRDNIPFLAVIFDSTDETEERVRSKDCATFRINGEANDDVFNAILRELLFEFPVKTINFNIPEWMNYLSPDCSAIAGLLEKARATAAKINKTRDAQAFDNAFEGDKYWQNITSQKVELSTGKVDINLAAKEGIYFEMLSEIAGDEIKDESSLMRYISLSSGAKKSYDKIKDAFECAKVNGYGIVEPDDSVLQFDKPEVVRQGGSVGIKLRATAPCYHIVKVDVTGEVSPIMGNAKQSESIVEGMMNGFETNPDTMWETNLFGKSLKGMVKEGLSGKVCSMHDETKSKMRRAISRIVNEGKGGVICILL